MACVGVGMTEPTYPMTYVLHVGVHEVQHRKLLCICYRHYRRHSARTNTKSVSTHCFHYVLIHKWNVSWFAAADNKLQLIRKHLGDSDKCR